MTMHAEPRLAWYGDSRGRPQAAGRAAPEARAPARPDSRIRRWLSGLFLAALGLAVVAGLVAIKLAIFMAGHPHDFDLGRLSQALGLGG